MKAIIMTIAAVLCAPALVACGGDDDDDDGGGGGNLRAACEKGCQTTATLGCPNDEPSTCVQDCENEVAPLKEAFPDCASQLDAAAVCFANLPAQSWSCNADGESEPDMSACSAETQAVSDCFSGG